MERREGTLTPIGAILDRNIILKGADILSAKGFTQVPNHVLVSSKLSPGAKLTYAMLLKYAWQNDFCFPGQERLAKDMGVTDRSVRTYLQELEAQKFIAIKQRGLGKPNLYELNLSASAADRKIFPVRTGKK
ncbi:MAG: helix-turn-helix domain-containing protein [Stellaceae bacterium]